MKYCDKKVDDIKITLKPIFDSCDSTTDEAMSVLIYYRKGNDIFSNNRTSMQYARGVSCTYDEQNLYSTVKQLESRGQSEDMSKE